jgi:hypothetical protein
LLQAGVVIGWKKNDKRRKKVRGKKLKNTKRKKKETTASRSWKEKRFRRSQ